MYAVICVVPPAPTQLRVVFSAYKIEVEFMQAVSKVEEICSNLKLFVPTDSISSWFQP